MLVCITHSNGMEPLLTLLRDLRLSCNDKSKCLLFKGLFKFRACCQVVKILRAGVQASYCAQQRRQKEICMCIFCKFLSPYNTERANSQRCTAKNRILWETCRALRGPEYPRYHTGDFHYFGGFDVLFKPCVCGGVHRQQLIEIFPSLVSYFFVSQI